MADMAAETQPLNSEPLKRAVWINAFFACLSGLLLGYDIGITNGALGPVTSYFTLSPWEMSWFVGILNVMALPGCFLGGHFSECFGRRKTIAIGATMFFVGNFLMTFAMDYQTLLTGRAIAGVAIGMTLVVEPLYTAETSPAKARGMLSTNVETSFNTGILLGFIASWMLGDLPDETSWRWMFGMCLGPPVVSLIGVFCFIPESPRWLAARGRVDEAGVVLQSLLGPREASEALEKLQQSLKAKPELELSWWTLFTHPKTQWLAFIGGGIAFFSQATGIETIMYYTGVILTDAGMTRSSMLLAVVIMGVFKLTAILVQGYLVDTCGRRPLLMISSIGMAMSMSALACAFWMSWSWMMKVAPIIAFVVLFSLGYGPITYTLNAELYPTSCRAKGLSLAMGTARGVSALVAVTFLYLVQMLSYGGAFFFYAVWGVIAAAFVILVVPETNGAVLADSMEDSQSAQSYMD